MKRAPFLALTLGLLALPASAEIRITGQAAMGLTHESGKTSYAAGTRVTATFSGVTDGGMEYGAIIDLDQTANGLDQVFNSDAPRAQVYISGGNHSLTVGKAVQNAPQSLMD
jgi:hypothetical protein